MQIRFTTLSKSFYLYARIMECKTIPTMIYFTQLVYIKEGQEAIFHQFEDIALPAISKYNGRLLLRLRPNESSFIEGSMERPYEIHFVEFMSVQDFQHFTQDKERIQFLHLKEQSIKASILIQGTML